MRNTAKAAFEWATTATGAAAAVRRLHADRVAVLAYHNVVEDHEAGRGDASLHLPLSRFLDQLDRLTATHEVVDLAAAARPGRGPRAVITFDDAYRGAVHLAFPELRRRGLPAVVFVSPGLLGQDGLWWDELAEAGRLAERDRATAMWEQRGRLEAVRRLAFGDRAPPSLPDSYGVATVVELEAAAGGVVAVGGHGWDHACLPALDPGALDEDLTRTLDWVERFPAPSARWLALPYGEGNPAVAGAALKLGYEGVLEIRGGLWRPPGSPGSVPRINVPAGLSGRGFELRTSGVL